MSTRAIRRNMKKQKDENEFFIDMVCAVPEEKKLYITSGTASRIMEGLPQTLELIEEYEKRYPNYQLTVNNSFYACTFGVVFG